MEWSGGGVILLSAGLCRVGWAFWVVGDDEDDEE
jgi:hypothetical protein